MFPHSTSAEHMKENIDIFDFALTDDEMTRSRALASSKCCFTMTLKEQETALSRCAPADWQGRTSSAVVAREVQPGDAPLLLAHIAHPFDGFQLRVAGPDGGLDALVEGLAGGGAVLARPAEVDLHRLGVVVGHLDLPAVAGDVGRQLMLHDVTGDVAQ